MSDLLKTKDYKEFRLKLFHIEQGYVVWYERLDGRTMTVGDTSAPRFGTHYYSDEQSPIDAAKFDIDNGAVK